MVDAGMMSDRSIPNYSSIGDMSVRGIPSDSRRILMIGAEQHGEFAKATRLAQRGDRVTVVNPIVTTAAQEYSAHGGDFRPIRLETLPRQMQFDQILENYPYPLGRTTQAVEFARQRFARLRPAGCWRIITENREFADALQDIAKTQGLSTQLSRLSLKHAPPASPRYIHPLIRERYRLRIKRLFI